MDEEKTLDFFLSYKSEDAVIVRMVAEQMRATGASVWFAEYDVGLANREHFMEEIETGIARCRFGICFTNNEFATSSYCRKELELLLKHIGPRRIIEVALPREDLPHHTFPQMKEAMSIEIPIAASRKCDGASQTLPCTTVHEILEFVQESTGVPLSRPLCSESAHTDKRYYRYAGDHYSLDLGGWAVKRPNLLTRLLANRGGDRLGPMFERECEGGRLSGHLLVGIQDVQRAKTGIGTANDREYYDEALDFADAFFGSVRKRHCIGVHLIFLKKLSHPAVTTAESSATGIVMGRSVWSRIYSVVLEDPKHRGKDREFAFFFFFEGSLSAFLGAAHLMDRLVLSLEYGSPVRRQNVDDQTRQIIDYLTENQPEYLQQISWTRNTLVRVIDFLSFGLIGRLRLSRARRSSRPIDMLSSTIISSSSRKVMSQALFYRGCELYRGLTDADTAIADYSLALWCDPTDVWARKTRAEVYEINRRCYESGDSTHVLPMTYHGACADLEAAIAFFRSAVADHSSDRTQQMALRMLHQCEATLSKLRASRQDNSSERPIE